MHIAGLNTRAPWNLRIQIAVVKTWKQKELYQLDMPPLSTYNFLKFYFQRGWKI